jgi:hypothetical protein
LESVENLDSPRAIFERGEEVEIYLGDVPTIQSVHGDKGKHPLKPFGPVKNIIEAGGLTAYNKKRVGL